MGKNEEFGERRSRLWRIIGAESPFRNGKRIGKGIFRKIRSTVPDFTRKLFQYALQHQEEEAYFDAEEAYKKSLMRNETVEGFNNYAILLDLLARYREAKKYFTQALEIDPTNTQVIENYIDFLIHVDLMKDAQEYARKWVNIQPQRPKAWLRYAFILVYQGKFDEAEKKFQKYEKLSSKEHSSSFPFFGRSSSYLKFAIRLAFLGSKKAKKYVEKISRGGKNPVYGLVMTLLGEYNRAEKTFRNEVETTPQIRPDVQVAYASVLEKQGKRKKAEKMLKNSLKNSKKEATTLSHLANLLLVRGKDEEAWEYHKKALKNNPQNALVHFSYAQFLTRKNESKANRHFLRALEIAPRAAEIHLAYGNYLMGTSRSDGAARHLQRAAELNPKDSLIHLSLAKFFKLRGRHIKAEKHRKKAYKLNSEVVRENSWRF